jgi:hypothetical protein
LVLNVSKTSQVRCKIVHGIFVKNAQVIDISSETGAGGGRALYPTQPGAGDVSGIKEPAALPELPKNTHFYMSAQLDNTRINRDVQRLVEEVISHLSSVDGAALEVVLELNVKAPSGLPQNIVRTVSENCRTLKVKTFGFDE